MKLTMMKFTLTAALFLLAGCGAPQPSNPTAIKNPDTYTYVTISDLDSLDPAWSYDTASHLVILTTTRGTAMKLHSCSPAARR